MAYIGSKPANKPVVASDLDPTVITGQTALAVAPADTDEFLISDAGVLKRLDASLIGGGGKIGQVLSDISNTAVTSTASSYTDVPNLSIAITPSAASSKILIIASVPVFSNGGFDVVLTLLRGSTNLASTASSGFGKAGKRDGSSWENHAICGMNFLDSPSSTSELTYKVQFKTSDGGIHSEAPTSSITVLEVLA